VPQLTSVFIDGVLTRI